MHNNSFRGKRALQTTGRVLSVRRPTSIAKLVQFNQSPSARRTRNEQDVTVDRVDRFISA